MGYQAQLVIRARDPERARIVERVKTLADEQGKSIVEMAFDLLERGMLSYAQGGAVASVAPVSDDVPKTQEIDVLDELDDEPVSSDLAAFAADEDEAVVAVDSEASVQDETSVRRKPSLSEFVDEIPEKIEYKGEPPSELARRCADVYGADGAGKAAATLTGFFAGAEPGEAAVLREALQEFISKTEYEAILEELKQTDEYRQYRRRVVYS